MIVIRPVKSFSQDTFATSYKDSTVNYIELQGFGSSTSRTPFWIQANQYGVVPKSSPVGSVRGGLEKFYNLDENNLWRVGGGLEAVGNFTRQGSKILLPQAYGSLRFRNWELYIGRKKQSIGLADSTLGTGSYAWSNNAMPIPRIFVGTRGFVNIPYTKGWLSFNAFYSEGLFESGRPVTSHLKLHQKMFYARLGKATSRVKFYGGFNHQVQWGGYSPYNTVDGKMPTGFANYINVILGKAHSKNNGINDETGRVGNHLGSIDLALEIETYAASIFLYRQNIYEDGSLIWLSNIKDGLNGIRIQRKNSYGANFEITAAVFEFLYTKNQGGDTADWNKPSYARGKDDYFNNGQVHDGWSYYDRAIGTPFIPPTSDTYPNWPKYSDFFTSNNRVSVFHIGLRGTLYQKVNWTSKFSYSNNSGTYDVPFNGSPTQFSGLIALQTKVNLLGGTLLKGSLAADIGDLYPKNYGFTLGLRKEFSF
ncbi:capsule assembly Wzi family protein [Dyadobacter sp. NIV53]|uniref:capsule assembly Wzi family protein n=1 Tax=Dyadobacter sp. NIV53 TaxID=2861765 RepID=UPI001E4E518A|nr:capsule assembly Wzi family protein [Dyadobacter sp. NIV53]